MKLLRLFVVRLLAMIPLQGFGRVIEDAKISRTSRRLAHIGKQVTLSQGLYIEVPENVRIEDQVSLGVDVKIMGGGGCTLGKGTMVATSVIFLSTTHDRRAKNMRLTGIHRPIVVEEGCWIGAGAILLPGARVCAGSVVGAGAVVSGEIPAGMVALGVPARARFARTDDIR